MVLTLAPAQDTSIAATAGMLRKFLAKLTQSCWPNNIAILHTVAYTRRMLQHALCDAQPIFRKVITVKLINEDTKTFKVFQVLRGGEAMTASRAKKMGIGNLAAEISRIRNHGFCVYTDKRKATNGVEVTEYVLGKPSRRLISAGYKAIALGIA